MIGYLVEQELANALPQAARLATLLTHIEVDPDDPAFGRPENLSVRSTIGQKPRAHALRMAGR